jgi:RNA polymerase sigma-70 factor (ECF subfamily)
VSNGDVRTTAESGALAEPALLDALRQGDEAAFAALVDRYHASMTRVAMLYVATRAVAEEVVQETWLAVFQGVERFEGRSSLRTWLFRILTNIAQTRGAREARSVPLSSLARDEDEGPCVDPSRWNGPNDRWPDHWAVPPKSWGESPETRLLTTEVKSVIADALASLPESQRRVMTLRDIEGLASEEVCGILGISEGNQRVLLHRARSKVRAVLERVFGGA